MVDASQVLDLFAGGPGAPPQPWIVKGGSISYDGSVLLPATVTGGDTGPGTMNINQLYVKGVAVVNPVGNFLPLSGGTLTGTLTFLNVNNLSVPGGAPGQALTTNGAGVLGWSGAPAGGPYLPLTGGALSGPLQITNPTNLVMGGGIANQLLTTDGLGHLSWTTPNNLITIGTNPPASPLAGSMWFDNVGGQLYVWYTDADSSQWVVTNNLTVLSNYLPLAGGTLTGPLVLAGDPTVNLGAATKEYVDAAVANYLPLTGGAITGRLSVSAYITNNFAVPAGVTSSSGIFANEIQSSLYTVNLYQASSTNGWNYINAGCGLYLSTYASGAQLLVAASGTTGAGIPGWGGTFYFSATGGFSANGSISASVNVTAGNLLQCNNLSVNNAVSNLQFYPSGVQQIMQYTAGYYWGWANNTGVLQWVANQASVFSITPAGAMSVSGTVTAGGFSCGGTYAGGTFSGNLNGTWVGGSYNAGLTSGRYYGGTFDFGWDGSAVRLALGGTDYGMLPFSLASIANYYGLYRILFYSPSPQASCTLNGGQSCSWAVTYSDRRLKTNIVPAEKDAIAMINQLKVHELDLTPPLDGSLTQHWEFSLIADEVEPIIPHAYMAPIPHPRSPSTGDEESKYEYEEIESYANLNQLPIVCTLVAAMQQMSAKMTAMMTQNDSLLERLIALEARYGT